ncbi:MAG TPA: UDP-glucose/GDP-mannose dehydrogenase family protein [Acidimicrobiales bacterium]|jgi:UDPglucose 6-dehydrogenase|nr:UDP-glucose/GDP-mannose dehydrogenase family protein [Acidimicrobiales bacterium]
MSQNPELFGSHGRPPGRRTGPAGGPGPIGASFGHGGATVRVLPHGRGRTVAVIGMGYVGLPTAGTLAHLGHRVTCGDSDPSKVAMLEQGRVPIVEDQLEELVREGQAAGRLRFVVGAKEAVESAEFVFLCVPTPQGPDGSADLSFVEAVAKEIGPAVLPGTVIVNKSTVPVGSTLVVDRVLGRHDVSVVSNPEFLREGTAVADSLHPERIVVGADDQSAAAKVGELFAGTHAPLLITDAATAETIKYAANAFLATKLSFVNAVAGLCEAVGADVRDVILGLGYDKRIGFEFLRPGPGWGGSCLPKDTRALVQIADQAGYDFSFLKGAIATNEEQFVRVVDKVKAAVGGDLAGTVIAVLGLTFKAGTDDLRNSPAIEIVQRLVDGGAIVQAFDPTIPVPDDHASAPVEELASLAADGEGVGMAAAVRAFPDAYAACEGATAAVVLTEWDQFRWLDFGRVKLMMAAPVVVDARNLLDPAQLRRIGFEYTGIGRR